MRRNGDLVMISRAGGYDSGPKMNMRKAIPALIQATEDKDWIVRAWAALALGEIGPDAKEAVPALRRALKDPGKDARQFAKRAIGKIQI